MRQTHSQRVAVAFIGDAAVEEGVFHEAANFAALHRLPIVFVVENNLFSVYTRLDDRQPDRPLERLGVAHNIPAITADGNDAALVYEITSKAVARARAGEGPSFLVFDTYRWLEHCGPNYDNDIGYRTPEEFETWKRRDPLVQSRERLMAMGLLTDAQESALRRQIDAEIDDAFQFALDSPLPEPGEIAVYA